MDNRNQDPGLHKEHSEILKELTDSLKEDVDRGLKLLDTCVTQIAQAKWILTHVNSTVEEYSKQKSCPVCLRNKTKLHDKDKHKKTNGSASPIALPVPVVPGPKNSISSVTSTSPTKQFVTPQRSSPNNNLPKAANVNHKPYKAGPLSRMRHTLPLNPIITTPPLAKAIEEQPKLPKTLSIIVSQTKIQIPLQDISPLIKSHPTSGILLSDLDTSVLMKLPVRPRNLIFRSTPITSKKPLISKVSGNMKNKPAGLASQRFFENLNGNPDRTSNSKDGKKYLTPATVESDSDSSSNGSTKKAKSTVPPPPKHQKRIVIDSDSSDSDFVKPKSITRPIHKKTKPKKSNSSSEASSIDSQSDSDSENEKVKKKPKKPLSTKMKFTIKNESVKIQPSTSLSSHSNQKKVSKDKDKEKEKKEKHHHRERSNSVTSSSHSHNHKKDKNRERDRDREKEKNKDKEKERKHSTDSRKHRDKERKHSTDKKEKQKHRSRSRSKERLVSTKTHSIATSEKEKQAPKPVKRERSSSVDSNTTEYTDLTKSEQAKSSITPNPLFDSLLNSKRPESSKIVPPVPPLEPRKLTKPGEKSDTEISQPKSNEYKAGPASMMKSLGQSISDELNKKNKLKQKETGAQPTQPVQTLEVVIARENDPSAHHLEMDSKSETGKSEHSVISIGTSVVSTMASMKKTLCDKDEEENPPQKKILSDKEKQEKAQQLRAKATSDPKIMALLKKRLIAAQKAKAAKANVNTNSANTTDLPPAPKSTTSECKSTVSEAKSTTSAKNGIDDDAAIEPGDDVISKCLALANIEEESSQGSLPKTPTKPLEINTSLKFEIKTPPDLQDCISPTGVSKFFGTNRLSTDSNSN